MDEVSIQQTSPTTFIVRFYNDGKNYPEPHSAIMDVVIDDSYYYVFGYLSSNDYIPSAKHQRQGHKFFKEMGLKPVYVRGKHLIQADYLGQH